MKRRSEKQGLALARKFEASGWSQAEFARRSRMRVATLRFWRAVRRAWRGGCGIRSAHPRSSPPARRLRLPQATLKSPHPNRTVYVLLLRTDLFVANNDAHFP